MSGARTHAVLVTGATGYVGGVLAAALLAQGDATVVMPIRQKHSPDAARARLLAELVALGCEDVDAALARGAFVPLPRTQVLNAELVAHLVPLLSHYEISEVVHSAGSLSYFNTATLRAGNYELTLRFLELARILGVARFAYVSTAFSSGYVSGAITERLHPEPFGDPNGYTRSKRATESLVAESGVPYLIVRPSIVVGHSTSGFYQGKPYGAYQAWTGLSKFLCDRYRPVLHAVAPVVPLNLVHQDSMQAGFLAARRGLPPNSIVHLVSRDEITPTTRDYWHAWMEKCGRPREVRYCDSLDLLDRAELDDGERLMIDFAEANIEISTRRWRFETKALDTLRAGGLLFRDVTVPTLRVCLDWFLEQSPRARAFMQQYAHIAASPKVVEMGSRAAAS